MQTFNAIDVETANSRIGSICQIGVVQVRDGTIEDEWQSLIDPEDEFSFWNTKVHGITLAQVKDSPILPRIWDSLRSRLRGTALISHGWFDRGAFEKARIRYGLDPLEVQWLDSCQLVRRTWPERYAKRGYGLKNVARDLGISFRHHDALEDARTASRIVLHACQASGNSIEDWLRNALPRASALPRSGSRPVAGLDACKESMADAPAGSSTCRPRRSVVFTGSLGIRRKEAARMAEAAGLEVRSALSRSTDFLVAGEDPAGQPKSSKRRQAEAMLEKGSGPRIISEDDFLELVGQSL